MTKPQAALQRPMLQVPTCQHLSAHQQIQAWMVACDFALYSLRNTCDHVLRRHLFCWCLTIWRLTIWRLTTQSKLNDVNR